MVDSNFNTAANNHNYQKTKRRISRQRQRTHNKRHRNIALHGWYPSGYYLADYDDKENTYVRKGNRGSLSKYLKKVSSKQVRHLPLDKLDTNSKGAYKKVFDFWWTLT